MALFQKVICHIQTVNIPSGKTSKRIVRIFFFFFDFEVKKNMRHLKRAPKV